MELARRLGVLVVLISAVAGVFAADDVFRVKGQFGFISGEDKIVRHHFIDDGRKLVIIGQKSIQVWDVPENRMLVRANHQIPQFAPRGFFSSFVLMGLPQMFAWREYVIDAKGTWLATAEKVGSEQTRSLVIRSLTDLEVKKVVRLPDGFSVEFLYFDPDRGTLELTGTKDRASSFASLDTTDFKIQEICTIDYFNWRELLSGRKKMIVGSGDSKVVWTYFRSKQGPKLTLRDVATGQIEKEFTAPDLKPETSYVDAFLTRDEKFLVARREGKLIGWEVAGDGKPAFVIAKPNPQSKFDLEKIHEDRYIVVFIDNELQIYDIWQKGKLVLKVTPSTPKEDLDFTDILPKGYAVVRVQAKIHIYELDGGTLKLAVKSENDPKDRVEFRAISDDNKMIAVADDNRVVVYDIDGDGSPRLVVRRDSPKERLATVKFYAAQNAVGIARVNNAEKKEPRTEFYDLSDGKVIYTAPFAIASGAIFDVDGSMLYQVRLGGVDVWNRATRQNFTVQLETYTETDYNLITGESTSGEKVNLDEVFFDPELVFFVSKGRRRTGIYEMKSGRLIQSIAQPAEMINPKFEGRPMIIGVQSLLRIEDSLFAGDPLMLVANDGRVVTLWEMK